MKACSKCGNPVELERATYCRSCNSAYQRKWRRENPERWSALQRKKYLKQRANNEWVASERKRGILYWTKLRAEVMDAYGGALCACCGEDQLAFLSIDHIANDGAAHRRSMGAKDGNGKGASTRTLIWLKRNGFPPGFQVLCMNCNFGKQRNGGVCPHQSIDALNRDKQTDRLSSSANSLN